MLEPITDMKYIAEKYGKTHAFIGNVDTRVLLNGTKDDIYREVKRCMDIGKKGVLVSLWRLEIISRQIHQLKMRFFIMKCIRI